MKIGITGGLGFIGSHTVEAALNCGHQVVVLDNYHRALYQPKKQPGLTIYRGDIRQPIDLQKLADCDVILNLAAESSVMRCEDDPQYAEETNVVGVYNLAQFCIERGIRLVQASSREVYGEVSQLPVPEEAPYGAKNRYGLSKQEAELLLLAYRNEGLNVSILRFSNVIGTRDRDRLLALWLVAAKRGQPLIMYGGRQVLDFVPVQLAASALLFAAAMTNLGPINIASGKATSIRELAARIKQFYPTLKIDTRPARNAEVTGFQADVTKMVNLGIFPPDDPLSDMTTLVAHYQ